MAAAVVSRCRMLARLEVIAVRSHGPDITGKITEGTNSIISSCMHPSSIYDNWGVC